MKKRNPGIAQFFRFRSESSKYAHRQVNRKRSLRWCSDETRLLEKYGAGGHRYADLYITEPDRLCPSAA